ncbi:ScbA/BarX family gamma-butyrolactone biosynthesis protein [Streptacidiphilus sp. MAP5-52]|uniref:ScbA/BarX family gamma-butyrolactone biosynthesis protein n=1 Tax=Streptacidiphilus sp. MAP5-52 TaxID=3156267 RepID=UPI003515068F
MTDHPRALLPSQHGAEEGGLTFVRTAPRHLVDRAAVAEVLITDWQRLGAETFRLGAQWPRGHSFYTPLAGSWHDPLLMAETLRQASSLVGHLYYGVPDGHPCSIEALDVEVVPAALLLGQRPAEVSLEVSCRDVRHHGGRLASMTLEAGFLRGDTFAGTGRLVLRNLEPPAEPPTDADAEAEANADVLPELSEAVPAVVVGRLHEHDVVLGMSKRPSEPGTYTWQLRVDPTHPVLYDPSADRIPPMLFLEAARQAAQAVCAPYRILPVDIRSAFRARAEPGLPCTVTAMQLPSQDAGEDAVVRVTATQDGQLVFDSVVVASLCD